MIAAWQVKRIIVIFTFNETNFDSSFADLRTFSSSDLPFSHFRMLAAP
jgi:hypothetical protein